nr:beta-galactosidase trimerization domain-containing protein [Lactobacillus johnsonii]
MNFEGKEYPMYDYCETLINCTGKVLATYSKDFYRNTPAIVEHSYGAGKGYYLACRTDYSFLEKFYEKIASELVPEIPITKFNGRVSIQIRENKSEKYWFVRIFLIKKKKLN